MNETHRGGQHSRVQRLSLREFEARAPTAG